MVLKLDDLDAASGVRIVGGGFSVSSAGDFNGDGLADFMVGDPWANNRAGAVYVIYGSATGLPATIDLNVLIANDGLRINGVNTADIDGYVGGDQAGWSVSSAGDVNQDGYDDIIFGATQYSGEYGGNGMVYVVFGAANLTANEIDLVNLDGENGFLIYRGIMSLGIDVAGPGDINGDGVDDMIMGASGIYEYSDSEGATYVVYGNEAGYLPSLNLRFLTPEEGTVIHGAAEGTYSGSSVAGVGDVNADGYNDIIVNAPRRDTLFDENWNAISTVGNEAYVLFGSADGIDRDADVNSLDGNNGFRITGELLENNYTSRFSLRTEVSGAGDVNADGIDDIIVSTFGTEASDAYVIFGSADGFAPNLAVGDLNGSNGFSLTSGVQDSRIASVSGVGDINGDGVDDIVIGMPNSYRNSGQAPGSAHVVFGSSSGFAARLDLSVLPDSEGFRIEGPGGNPDWTGFAVSGSGDVNGDGVADLLIGSYSAAYLVFGMGDAGGAGPADDIPVAADDIVTTAEDTPLAIASVELLANDSPGALGPLTLEAVFGAEGGSVELLNGSVNFTPALNFFGDAKFRYRVADAAGTFADAQVTVAVASVNDAPVAVNDLVTAARGEATVIDVLANDQDDGGFDPTSVRLVGADLGSFGGRKSVAGEGVFTVDEASGRIGFAPEAGFRGTPGPVSYTVRDVEDLRSNEATLSISVGPEEVRTVVTVHAAGTGDATGSPSFVVFADGVLLGAVEIADPVSEAQRKTEGLDFTPYVFEIVGTERPARIDIVHADNMLTALGNDVNLFVDRIEIDGRALESEFDGFFQAANGDPARSGAREALWWNGVLSFDVPEDDAGATQTLSVFAGGIGGVTRSPRFALRVDGVLIDSAEIADPQTRAEVRAGGYAVDRFDFEIADDASAGVVEIVFLNNSVDPVSGEDLALFVDAIELAGSRYESETDGFFTANRVGPGRDGPREELHWNGVLSFDIDALV